MTFKYGSSTVSYKWGDTSFTTNFSGGTALPDNTVGGLSNFNPRFSTSLGWGAAWADGCGVQCWPTFGLYNNGLYWSGVSQRSSIHNQGNPGYNSYYESAVLHLWLR